MTDETADEKPKTKRRKRDRRKYTGHKLGRTPNREKPMDEIAPNYVPPEKHGQKMIRRRRELKEAQRFAKPAEGKVHTAESMPEAWKQFCEGILQGMSQTDAYLYAGYDCLRHSAAVAGKNLSQRACVQDYLALRRDEIMNQSGCTLDWWVRRNMQIVNESQKKETAASRSAAMERLGRYLGAYQKDRGNESERPLPELLKELPNALKVLDSKKPLELAKPTDSEETTDKDKKDTEE